MKFHNHSSKARIFVIVNGSLTHAYLGSNIISITERHIYGLTDLGSVRINSVCNCFCTLRCKAILCQRNNDADRITEELIHSVDREVKKLV
jgi:hypothetical protein